MATLAPSAAFPPQLIQLFCCQSGLGHHIFALCWKTIIKYLGISDTDHISDLIPIIIGIETVGRRGLLIIIQLSVTACEMKALCTVPKPAGTYPINTFCINHHTDVHCDIQLIDALLQFSSDTFPFPTIPVRNMTEGCLTPPLRLNCPLFSKMALLSQAEDIRIHPAHNVHRSFRRQ